MVNRSVRTRADDIGPQLKHPEAALVGPVLGRHLRLGLAGQLVDLQGLVEGNEPRIGRVARNVLEAGFRHSRQLWACNTRVTGAQ